MVLNWSRKAVKMFGEVTPRMTKPCIKAKVIQLDEMFENEDFRAAGTPTTLP